MRKLSLSIVCLLAMMAASLSATAQEVTITLFPGWNWISYPNSEMQVINTALGDFVPVNGDIIKSQYGSSSYVNGYWRGSVTHFMPGWGYKYYSNREEIVSLVFTDTSPFIVTTSEPSDITATSAFVGGTVNVPEGGHVFQLGVCWGTEPTPDIDGSHTSEETGTGSFSSTLDSLSPNTTYYVRAYAVSDNGLAYGEELTFTTMNGIPSVSTAEVTSILGDGATCGGTVTDDGGLGITARGVCWSTSHNPTLSDSHTADGTGIGSFSSSLTGLTASTTYYVRAYASNSYVTIYGNEVSFTTLSGGSSPLEAIDFTVTDIYGNEIHLFDILDHGQAVLINFFFTTSGPDQQTMPKVVESYYAMGCNTHDVFYIEVSYNDSDEACLNWVNTYGVEFPTISGVSGGTNICNAYGIFAFPTVILIMPNRQIAIPDLWPIYNAQTIINALEGQGLEQHDCDEQ